MIKKVSGAILIVVVILTLLCWELITYGIQQATGQLNITLNTVPVEEVLADSIVADSVKNKIKTVKKSRIFAFEILGLSESNNYTSYYDQQGKVLLWNLSASKPYALEPKTWSFPLLGSFPYKGYFNLEYAQEELKELKLLGYDVRIRPVSGWSTLGWTNDPILSNMLERSEGSLAELIIHELTHATIFVKDNVEFNENIASFIGEKGAVHYLNTMYGKSSDAYFEYILAEEDSKTFREQMLLATTILDSVYQTFEEQETDSSKSVKKHIIIDQITSSIDTLHFHNPRYYEVFNSTRPNNAFFMSYIRYYSAKDSLEELLINQYQNDLRLFIKSMKEYHK